MDVSTRTLTFPPVSVFEANIPGRINLQRRQPRLAQHASTPPHHLALPHQHPPPSRRSHARVRIPRLTSCSRAILCPLPRPLPTSPGPGSISSIGCPPARLNGREYVPIFPSPSPHHVTWSLPKPPLLTTTNHSPSNIHPQPLRKRRRPHLSPLPRRDGIVRLHAVLCDGPARVPVCVPRGERPGGDGPVGAHVCRGAQSAGEPEDGGG